MTTVLDWCPTADLAVLRQRARLLAELRAFFAARGVWEVETPALSSAGNTDPNLTSLLVGADHLDGGHGPRRYLHTSPEYPMKRLLAAGSGSIYQIARVFRADEAGRLHNPEFTLLEWYRPGFDQHQLMDEVAALVSQVLRGRLPLPAPERLSYAAVFQRGLALDPHRVTVAELAACATAQGLRPPTGMPADDTGPWLDLLLSHCLQPRLGRERLTFVYDYPAAQAALACVRPGDPPLAERFELYVNGIELANGFHELADASEQRRRFEHDNRVRAARGLPLVPLDERLLAALVAGLPDCSGVALGVDRLLLLAVGGTALAEVLAFPAERA
jgi:lysyl-tRNA synthetase class 2